MNRIAIPGLLLAFMLSACNPGPEVRLHVRNPLDQSREDAIILLNRSAVEQWIEIPAGLLPILADAEGEPLPCQLDDIDGDGEWNELFALLDMDPLEESAVTLQLVPEDQYPAFTARTNIRLGANLPGYPELTVAERLEGITYHNHGRTGEVYQMEGPAWENDRVGFRNYLDQRNGMDIFGKLTAEMVMDSVGIAGRQSYHDPDDWGMDVLKVNTSLGAGAIAYRFNDSIYRVGDNGSGTYELVFEGPLRSRFNLVYDPWEIAGRQVSVLHQIEIIAGRHCYQSQVTLSGSDGEFDLVTGIVNIKSDSLYLLDQHPQYFGLMTHDLQSEDTTLLAMALLFQKMDLRSYGETRNSGDGVTETYYAVLETRDSQPVPYRFYALWEKEDPRWADPEQVQGYLLEEAARWNQSVTIEVEQ